MARREGINLDGREKIQRIMDRKPYPPGMHGQDRRPRLTDYGKQLREKQRAKLVFGVNERQFRNYFEKAKKKRGDTAQYLIQLLESRLDNVVYKVGFAKTRAAARQLVSHSNFDLNGQKSNVPSIQVVPGDVIKVRDNKKDNKYWLNWRENVTKANSPFWIGVDPGNLSIKILSLPAGEELKQQFDPRLIVEFYSR
jgi:small subunit ribosomal protein S4